MRAGQIFPANAGAAFGGALAALRAAGVVVPIPGAPGGSGGREPPRKANSPQK